MAQQQQNQQQKQKPPPPRGNEKEFVDVAREVCNMVKSEGRDLLRGVLPEPFRHMSGRFIARAFYYIQNKPYLWSCNPISLRDCILHAGELGLCLDGKMAHAVPYKGTAQLILDYKGIIAVARRHGLIVDSWAKHVHERDVYNAVFEDGEWKVTYQEAMGDRGAYLGTLCVLIFPGKRVFPEYMTAQEIESIRLRSKAKDDGPWQTDRGEMQKKTVIRRALKRYIDDPEVLMLMERDDDVIETTAMVPAENAAPAPSRTAQLVRGLPSPQESTDFSSMVGTGQQREHEEVPRQQHKEEPKQERQQEEPRDQELPQERTDDQGEPRRDRPQSSYTAARNRMVAAKSENDMLAIYEQEYPKLSEEDQHKLDEHKARLLKSFANSSVGQRSLPGADV